MKAHVTIVTKIRNEKTSGEAQATWKRTTNNQNSRSYWRDNRERFFAWAKLPGAPKLPNNPYAEKPRDAMGVLAVLLN